MGKCGFQNLGEGDVRIWGLGPCETKGWEYQKVEDADSRNWEMGPFRHWRMGTRESGAWGRAQVGHRHAERRVLVAEAVGDLAPLVAPEMRGSLLLSILQQLACDEDSAVRLATTCRLATLLPHLPDSDKFPLVPPSSLSLPHLLRPTSSPSLFSVPLSACRGHGRSQSLLRWS